MGFRIQISFDQVTSDWFYVYTDHRLKISQAYIMFFAHLNLKSLENIWLCFKSLGKLPKTSRRGGGGDSQQFNMFFGGSDYFFRFIGAAGNFSSDKQGGSTLVQVMIDFFFILGGVQTISEHFRGVASQSLQKIQVGPGL